MPRTLVIRLSALGDVAMLIPVLYSVAVKYPKDEFILATKSPLVAIFDLRPPNIKIIPVFTKDRHKGIFGLGKLIGELNSLGVTQVADIHDVLRSQQIRFWFQCKGKKIAVINKGRNEKKALTRKNQKNFHQLPTSIERYQDVFTRLGYDASLTFKTLFDFGSQNFELIESFTGKKTGKWIGIAPFAKHQGKQYPLERMEQVIKALSFQHNTRIFLFGSKEEAPQLESWAKQYDQVTSIAGHFTFSTELLLMSYLDVMLTMDSGNMHLASLVSVPVVSVWGATHPYAGFYGYGQDPENAIQANLFCRPCSVFGEKPCYRHNYECLYLITPEAIVKKINQV